MQRKFSCSTRDGLSKEEHSTNSSIKTVISRGWRKPSSWLRKECNKRSHRQRLPVPQGYDLIIMAIVQIWPISWLNKNLTTVDHCFDHCFWTASRYRY